MKHFKLKWPQCLFGSQRDYEHKRYRLGQTGRPRDERSLLLVTLGRSEAPGICVESSFAQERIDRGDITEHITWRELDAAEPKRGTVPF